MNWSEWSEWKTYFKSLTPESRWELHKALTILNNDEMIKENYGRDFKDLAMIIEYDC